MMFFLVPGGIVCQQAGLKYLKNYSRTDYDQQPQNWAILQDKRGIIYAGNNGCVLEFFFDCPRFFLFLLASCTLLG